MPLSASLIRYQIPSDLLSYDGPPDAPTATKLEAVRQHVKAITDMIAEAKKAEVEGARMHADFADPHGYAVPGATPSSASASGVEDEGLAVPKHPLMARSRSGRSTMMRSASAHGGAVEMASIAMSDASSPKVAEMVAEVAVDGAPTAGRSFEAPAQMPARATLVARQPTPTVEARNEAPVTAPSSPLPPASAASSALDFTALPRQLEASYEQFDSDAAIRPTRLMVGTVWHRRSYAALLAPPVDASVSAADQLREKRKAFDLLDALSRSGALPFDAASLHVVVAATHQFAHSLTATVISGNVNPIEKLERSSLIIASLIHGVPAKSLLSGEEEVARITELH